MKCSICLQKKGKRNCSRFGNLICSECCGKMRDIRHCESTCEYMSKSFERVDTSSVEVTEVGRGKVILFSDSLFLPDILECFYCDVIEMKINIIEPTKILFSTKFIIKQNTTRAVSLKEAYISDSWKRNENSCKGIPFLQIYAIGLGQIKDIRLSCDNLEVEVAIENNHLDTWLPGAYSRNENLTIKEIAEIYQGAPAPKEALVYYGNHFLGNNSTLFAELQANKEYRLEFEMIYSNPQFEEEAIILPFGLFFPFSLVNYIKFGVKSAYNIELEKSSNTSLLLPFAEKEIMGFLKPLLKENALLSSPSYIKYFTNEIEQTFHYDNFCILHNQFKVKLKSKMVAKAIFSDLPILIGVYDAFNSVYNDEYAPVLVVICNNTDEIEKYKIDVEIMGISYKTSKEVFVENHKVNKFHIAPRLKEEKTSNIRINTWYDINVKVTNISSGAEYEESGKCLLYPREVFVEVLKNKTKDWKIDLKSFLARWITPTTVQIEEIITEAGKDLKRGIRGASSHNNMVIQEEMKSIYDVLGKTMYYVARPLAFAEGDYHVQNISLPSTTIRLNSGNCIDLTILLASCYEALKLHVFIILVPGHSFLKVELFEKETIYLESTFLGKMDYSEAAEKGRENYEKYFCEAGSKVKGAHEIDVSLARRNNIYPME